MASVELKKLTKSFGDLTVLHDLDLSVGEGEFVALVGPSGCGKSTLLRIIAGLEAANSGDVTMNGQWVNDLNPRERNIAMVFQSYALYPHMTVADNMGFNLRISGMDKAQIRKRVEETAEILNLSELMARKPSQLSGGQRQRVAMGRALVRNPDVFLFDEPLSNLDAKLRVQMREEIKRLHKRVRTTSIYVTHDQIEAMTLADRIVILHGGHIQQVGTPTDLYENPANVFVAGFIGSPSMNFLEATLSAGNGAATLSLRDGQTLNCPLSDRLPAQGNVTIGLRPEHLHVAPSGANDNVLRGTLELLEPTGAQNHLRVSMNGSTLTAVDNTLARVVVDQPVALTIEPDKIHVFARRNG